jgi:hypothetical protein
MTARPPHRTRHRQLTLPVFPDRSGGGQTAGAAAVWACSADVMRLRRTVPTAGRRDAARRLQEVGYGKDLSMYGFEDYTRVKHVMSYLGG